MKRQDKYPETSTFHFYNANPHNRLTTDCVIRALSTALEIPYNDVVMELAELQCQTGFDPSEKKTYDKFLQKHGWIKMPQPKKPNGNKYTGAEFCSRARSHLLKLTLDGSRQERVIANIGGHHIVAIIDYKVWDTWDSTDGCIGNYWVRR